MTPEQILRGGAEVLKEKGWTRGDYEALDGSGSVCALGALRYAAWGSTSISYALDREPGESYRQACKILRKVMIEQLEHDWVIPHMNDELVRSGEELIGYMVKAANNLEA